MHFKFRNILSLLPCLTVLWSKCFPLLYHSHKSGERENLSSCGTPVSKAVNWLFYSLKHRIKWLFSLCESSVFLGARVRFCARAKKFRVLEKRFPLAHYFKAGAICTNRYSIFTMLKYQAFLLFMLLIANSGNYLHLSIVVHYKTCNKLLSVNFNIDSNYYMDATLKPSLHLH